MKHLLCKALFCTAFLLPAACLLHAQEPEEPKEKTVEEAAADEADRLASVLKLADWQVFRVDSTLQHDYRAWRDELKSLQDRKVENYNMYVAVKTKWEDIIDASYKRIFTPAQWEKYVRTSGHRKAREKGKKQSKK